MRSLALIALHWLHQVAISVWLGGILTLGAISAPAVFRTAKSQGHTETGMPLYDFAGTAVQAVFQRFNYAILVAGAMLLLAGLAYGMLAGLHHKAVMTRAALTGVAWIVSLWLTFSLFPAMLQARAAGQSDLFDGMHRTYNTGFSVQLLLLFGVAALTAWLDHRRTDPAAEAQRADAPSRPHPAANLRT